MESESVNDMMVVKICRLVISSHLLFLLGPPFTHYCAAGGVFGQEWEFYTTRVGKRERNKKFKMVAKKKKKKKKVPAA
jgi:hypothetical protein